jgi:hypothetical protein
LDFCSTQPYLIEKHVDVFSVNVFEIMTAVIYEIISSKNKNILTGCSYIDWKKQNYKIFRAIIVWLYRDGKAEIDRMFSSVEERCGKYVCLSRNK